ncbi:DNA (cytosine-5-)-methyltransferase [Rhodococcus sp. RS1C4]|nr:DNA (cytosine-5-)-methyltransferase [Rhodococcus sp. RS1C4]OZD15419.1 DNA (cytosine-5-)-methyltransferase [Rhodococcus sp. 06-156-4C]OZD20135.1 DNA (cytosine-5-)-methyltransferase [Rhodococcus sp. 06-156-4a]OZD23243.1 DNA (cytosine-5-)-methyltransferase [Rhodococcus sp. 06-156-3C]OZD26153.1 DNA (cytosine-5-)-methyltransferase [Rhodococcus sp. 06-156-3b]OZD38360.1 DNA (cytosine-5-)-methyltransferase [Rhodococcus sp. 06-156-3]OZD62816.1 DNA (cytosine-5-)-methyltransferase [Rhodococcus sp. 06
MGSRSMVGLFAGIGGLELGLSEQGWSTELLCEIDPGAGAVLAAHFPDVPLHRDVTKLRALPSGTELVAAGFPCQDLSQAGRTAGITGERSGLVDEVFRLVKRRNGPRWLLIENVPFMLQLGRGAAMRHITDALSDLGYMWAYRVVDARSFGLPQRRQRVLMLASRTEDPREILFAQDEGPLPDGDPSEQPCGFYWTEGTRGLGWAVNAVPTLKGGSSLGIASPPAVRLPSGEIVTPGIVGAERLQGFDPDWTAPALGLPGVRAGHRWKLVGNAVSVRMASWVAAQIERPQVHDDSDDVQILPGQAWPAAAWGAKGSAYRVHRSTWPVHEPYENLSDFLDDSQLLSARATAGFLKRARMGNLRFQPGFLDDVESHLDRMGGHPSPTSRAVPAA